MAEIGGELRAAREARGMSLTAVQQELHIRERYLEALEQDDWEQFPGIVYARGFLRSYARYLGLDADDLLARMPKPPEAPEPAPVETNEPPRRRQMRPMTVGRGGSQWPWVVIPLIFLVALLYFVGSHPNLFGGAETRTPPVTTTAGQKKHPTQTRHKHKKKPTTQPTVALTPAAPSQGPYGGPEANYTVPSGPITVSLQLTAPCYVYVDIDGAATPQTATVETSGTLQYTAQQSIVMKIGNPPAATLQVDGQTIPLPGSGAQSVGVTVQQGG